MSLKGTWAQIYREDATGLGYTVAPTTMPLTISDDSNDIRDVGPCCGYEDYYAESPMLPTEIGRTDLKRWISTTITTTSRTNRRSDDNSSSTSDEDEADIR